MNSVVGYTAGVVARLALVDGRCGDYSSVDRIFYMVVVGDGVDQHPLCISTVTFIGGNNVID